MSITWGNWFLMCRLTNIMSLTDPIRPSFIKNKNFDLIMYTVQSLHCIVLYQFVVTSFRLQTTVSCCGLWLSDLSVFPWCHNCLSPSPDNVWSDVIVVDLLWLWRRRRLLGTIGGRSQIFLNEMFLIYLRAREHIYSNNSRFLSILVPWSTKGRTRSSAWLATAVAASGLWWVSSWPSSSGVSPTSWPDGNPSGG